jgi:bacillithiol system protein YtxJ
MPNQLTTQAEAEALIDSPSPAWLLKHSNACPISFAALDAFTAFMARQAAMPAGVLVIQEQRQLSNWVADRIKRAHQSPQVFLLRSGQVLWTATHWSITVSALAAALAAHAGSP